MADDSEVGSQHSKFHELVYDTKENGIERKLPEQNMDLSFAITDEGCQINGTSNIQTVSNQDVGKCDDQNDDQNHDENNTSMADNSLNITANVIFEILDSVSDEEDQKPCIESTVEESKPHEDVDGNEVIRIKTGIPEQNMDMSFVLVEDTCQVDGKDTIDSIKAEILEDRTKILDIKSESLDVKTEFEQTTERCNTINEDKVILMKDNNDLKCEGNNSIADSSFNISVNGVYQIIDSVSDGEEEKSCVNNVKTVQDGEGDAPMDRSFAIDTSVIVIDETNESVCGGDVDTGDKKEVMKSGSVKADEDYESIKNHLEATIVVDEAVDEDMKLQAESQSSSVGTTNIADSNKNSVSKNVQSGNVASSVASDQRIVKLSPEKMPPPAMTSSVRSVTVVKSSVSDKPQHVRNHFRSSSLQPLLSDQRLGECRARVTKYRHVRELAENKTVVFERSNVFGVGRTPVSRDVLTKPPMLPEYRRFANYQSRRSSEADVCRIFGRPAKHLLEELDEHTFTADDIPEYTKKLKTVDQLDKLLGSNVLKPKN